MINITSLFRLLHGPFLHHEARNKLLELNVLFLGGDLIFGVFVYIFSLKTS